MSPVSLFSPKGIKELRSFCSRAPVVALDFDGTLVPLVKTPIDTRVGQDTVDILRSLQHHVEIWIVTGRRVQDIVNLLPIGVDHIIGNHGLESSLNSAVKLESARQTTRQWLSQIFSAEFEKLLNYSFSSSPNFNDVWVEDKDYSLSLHYRLCPYEDQAVSTVNCLVNLLQPKPLLVAGAKVVNLLPDGSGGKGQAIEDLMKATDHSAAIFFGDDVTDESVFSLKSEQILGVKVGNTTETTAMYFLEKQEDTLRALRVIQNNLLSMGIFRVQK